MQNKKERSEQEKVEKEYMDKFDVDRLPMFQMMQSVESYIEELRGAIKRGRPLTDEDRIECDIIDE